MMPINNINVLKRKISELKRSLSGHKLAKNDRLLIDIIVQLADILTSESAREKLLVNSLSSTSNTSDQEIKNETVLRLRDVLHPPGRNR